jgi:two-component system, sensor histidine kinase PdtaS
MSKTFFSGILVCLTVFLTPIFTVQLNAQHILDHRIDSLQKLIAKAPPDTSKVHLYLALTYNNILRYGYRGHKPSDSLATFQTTAACQLLSKKIHYAYGIGSSILLEAKFYAILQHLPLRNERLQQAFFVFRAANDKAGLAAAYMYKADIHPSTDTTPTKIKTYDTAVQLARDAGDPKREILALKAIADVHQQQGKYALTIKELLYILELQKKTGDDRMHYTTDLLAHAFLVTGNHKEALRYAIASLDHSRNTGDTILILTFYQRLGNIYFDLYNYEKALYYLRKALAAAHPDGAIHIMNDIARCLSKQQKYQEAFDLFADRLKTHPVADNRTQFIINKAYVDLYYYTGHYRESIQYFSKILQQPKELNFDLNEKTSLFTKAGLVYFRLHQFDKAAWYSDSAYKLALQVHSWHDLVEISLTLYRLDSIKGNYLSAIRHYQGYKNFSDSIQKDVADKQFAELAVQYETDQKNTELELLNNKALLQEDAIRQSRFLRNAMIAGSALLLLLLLVIFSRYRLKQKANRLLQQKQKEKDRLLVEKEWLLKEIHHRVKNNLQTVMSLLNSQSAYIDNEPARTAIHDSQHRVHAMSLIHQKLYNTENVSSINMSYYIRELVSYLADSFHTGQRIRFEFDIEPLEMDVSQAVPLGLILNEAITNAIKYAFPDNKQGMIFISLARTAPDRCLLCMADNGIGIPPGYVNKKAGSLGMSLMEGLSEDLDGRLSIENNNGTTIKVSFVYELGVKQAHTLAPSFVSNN